MLGALLCGCLAVSPSAATSLRGQLEPETPESLRESIERSLRGEAEPGTPERLRESMDLKKRINKYLGPRMRIYHLHIPRTAGTSFFWDVPRVFNISQSMVSKEGCWKWKDRLKEITHVATFLRDPRSHVLSQWKYCSQGSIHLMTQVHKFRPWLKDWQKLLNDGKLKGDFGSRSQTDRQLKFQKYLTASFLPFHCYSPSNLMVQHFSCRGTPFNYTGTDNTKLAIKNMEATWFVGITEAYKESICLLHTKVHKKLPDWCNCENKTAWESFKSSHSSYYLDKTKVGANVSELQPDTIQMIDNMTHGDRQLYQAGLRRFKREVREAEAKFHTKILCDDTLLLHQKVQDPTQKNFAMFLRDARTELRAAPIL